ncbi:MAG: phosphatidate cytidylyltransferase [Bacteroidota bacterium]
MALNKQTFITRTSSAVVFVAILLGAILYNYISFTILFFVIAMIALKEFMQLSGKLGANPYRGLAYFCASLMYLILADGFLIQPEGFFEIMNFFQPVCILIPFIIFSRALFDKREGAIGNALYTIIAIVYAVLPFILLNHLVGFKNESNTRVYNPQLLLGTIFLIWSNDTFAYIGGSLIGKHKMIARISPGKTWEGTIIGIVIAFALSFTFKYFLTIPFPAIWPVLGLLVPVLATLGDLVESLLKRKAGIKDSGQLMPGHGGALDRFDSIIFVSPFVYALVQIIS